jgi:hypothetical protein
LLPAWTAAPHHRLLLMCQPGPLLLSRLAGHLPAQQPCKHGHVRPQVIRVTWTVEAPSSTCSCSVVAFPLLCIYPPPPTHTHTPLPQHPIYRATFSLELDGTLIQVHTWQFLKQCTAPNVRQHVPRAPLGAQAQAQQHHVPPLHHQCRNPSHVRCCSRLLHNHLAKHNALHSRPVSS